MTISDAATPAEGFVEVELGGFIGLNGGFLRKEEGDAVLFGFVVDDRHCNPFGLCHGGWLSTMADFQLLFQASHQGGLSTARLVTASLTIDFVGAARRGAWIESRARVVRQTRTLLFMEGGIYSGARILVRMNGIFSIRQD